MLVNPDTMRPLFLAWLLLAAPPTPQDVAAKLISVFGQETGQANFQAPISRQGYVGFETQTIAFSLGPRLYRIVFSSDGSISVSAASKGDLAAQPLWTGRAKEASADQIVSLIYSQEFGRNYDASLVRKKPSEPETDAEAQKASLEKATSSLRWNSLMNRVLSGDALGGSSPSDGNGVSKEASMARMMEPCASNQGGAAPQRAVMTEIATAMAATQSAEGDPDALADRSRKYKKGKDYSFSKDLEEHEAQGQEGEAFHLIQQSRVATYDLFYEALRSGDKGSSTDPYAVAAKRNFKIVGRSLSEKKVKELIDKVIGKIGVDIDRFTALQGMVGGGLVVYDRAANKFYVDPTLRTAGEARYVLSLAVLYDWRIEQPDARELLAKYEEKRGKITEIEYGVLNEADARQVVLLRAEAHELARKLYEISENIWKLAARPAL